MHAYCSWLFKYSSFVTIFSWTFFHFFSFDNVDFHEYPYLYVQNVDIDECRDGTANCGPDETCKNKPGGYTCSCPAGFVLNAQKRCEDVNECEFYKGQVKNRKLLLKLRIMLILTFLI